MDQDRKSLKGSLSSIGLADIFQMLSMSGKCGTLTVSDAESRKQIYFGSGKVSLLSSGGKKAARLGEILVGSGKITKAQLELALREQKKTGDLLGSALVKMGFITQEDINDAVRIQIEDEICHLFAWENAEFEFEEGDPPPELVSPTSRATMLSFDVNALLMEAARRIDEWRLIQKEIPSPHMVFRRMGEPEAPPHKRLAAFFDGSRTVEEAIEAGSLPRFETFKSLYEMLESGYVKEVHPDVIREEAERNLVAGAYDRAIAGYSQLFKRFPKDELVRKNFVRVLLASIRNLSLHHDRDAIINTYRRVLDVDPSRGDVRVRLDSILTGRSPGRKKVAISVLLSVLLAALLVSGELARRYEVAARALWEKASVEVEEALGRGQYAEAFAACEQVATSYPWSTVAPKSRVAKERILAEASVRLGDLLSETEKTLASASQDEKEGKLERAVETCLRALAGEDSLEGYRGIPAIERECLTLRTRLSEAKVLLERLKESLRKSREHEQAASDLLSRAERFESDGRLAEGFEAYSEILARYPKSAACSRISIPMLYVESTPPGARITINGGDFGVTPAIVRYQGGAVVVRLEKKGYRPVEQAIDKATKLARVNLFLEPER